MSKIYGIVIEYDDANALEDKDLYKVLFKSKESALELAQELRDKDFNDEMKVYEANEEGYKRCLMDLEDVKPKKIDTEDSYGYELGNDAYHWSVKELELHD